MFYEEAAHIFEEMSTSNWILSNQSESIIMVKHLGYTDKFLSA